MRNLSREVNKEANRDGSREAPSRDLQRDSHRSASSHLAYRSTTPHAHQNANNHIYHSSHLLQPSFSGRGSITKGTSGKFEAVRQQRSPSLAGSTYNCAPINLSNDFHASSNVLQNDFMIAQQMNHSRAPPPTTTVFSRNPSKSSQSPVWNKEASKGAKDLSTKRRTQEELKSSQDFHRRRSSAEDVSTPFQPFLPDKPLHSAASLSTEAVLSGARPDRVSSQEVNLHRTSEQLHRHLSKFTSLPGSAQQMTAANLIEAIIYLQINKLDKSDALSPSSELNNCIFTDLPATTKRNSDFKGSQRSESADKEKCVESKQAPPSDKIVKGATKVHSTQNPPRPKEAMLTSSAANKISQGMGEEEEAWMRRKYSLLKDKGGGKDMKTRMIDEWLASSLNQAHHNDIKSQASPHKKARMHSPTPSPFQPYTRLTQQQLEKHQNLLNEPPERVITASDRIEAIIAADISSEDPGLLQNKGALVLLFVVFNVFLFFCMFVLLSCFLLVRCDFCSFIVVKNFFLFFLVVM